jgi:membrane protease subunit HflK
MATGFDPNNIRPPEISIDLIKKVAIGLVVLIGVITSTHTIGAEEVGVVLRFGEYQDTKEPGLRFILPYRLEVLEKVPVKRQLKEEFGFRTEDTDGRTTTYSSSRDLDEEALMLTGDLNAAQVEWVAQYTIDLPYNYLYKVKNVRNTFRYINEAVMREIVGDHSVDEVITSGRQQIANRAKEKIQELCRQYEMGIKVDQIILQDVNPPGPVKPAFNKVNEAEQKKDELINQAKSEYNKVIPKARGEALRVIEEAKGYAIERINNAEGEAKRFTALYDEYRKAKDVTRQRLYLEAMQTILNKVGRKLITDEETQGILPLFDYSKTGGKN